LSVVDKIFSLGWLIPSPINFEQDYTDERINMISTRYQARLGNAHQPSSAWRSGASHTDTTKLGLVAREILRDAGVAKAVSHQV
jgi:hypothetical protein